MRYLFIGCLFESFVGELLKIKDKPDSIRNLTYSLFAPNFNQVISLLFSFPFLIFLQFHYGFSSWSSKPCDTGVINGSYCQQGLTNHIAMETDGSINTESGNDVNNLTTKKEKVNVALDQIVTSNDCQRPYSQKFSRSNKFAQVIIQAGLPIPSYFSKFSSNDNCPSKRKKSSKTKMGRIWKTLLLRSQKFTLKEQSSNSGIRCGIADFENKQNGHHQKVEPFKTKCS